jgi:hypothetical protein
MEEYDPDFFDTAFEGFSGIPANHEDVTNSDLAGSSNLLEDWMNGDLRMFDVMKDELIGMEEDVLEYPLLL